MSGRPRRAAAMKRKRDNNDNNYIPAPKKAPKKATVKVTICVGKLSESALHMAPQVASFLEPRGL